MLSAKRIAKAGSVIAEALKAGQITKRGVSVLIAGEALAGFSTKTVSTKTKSYGKKCGKKCGTHHKKSGKKSDKKSDKKSVLKIVSSAGKKAKQSKEVKKIHRVQKTSPRHCGKCQSLEHDIRVCPDTVTCGSCGIRGHNSRGCSRGNK